MRSAAERHTIYHIVDYGRDRSRRDILNHLRFHTPAHNNQVHISIRLNYLHFSPHICVVAQTRAVSQQQHTTLPASSHHISLLCSSEIYFVSMKTICHPDDGSLFVSCPPFPLSCHNLTPSRSSNEAENLFMMFPKLDTLNTQ